MKNFGIVLIFCGFSIRINLCQESQVYTFYPSLTQLYDRVTQGRPNEFPQNPPQDEIHFQTPQITEYVFKTDPEQSVSPQTGDQIRTKYPSESVKKNEYDVVRRVTYISSPYDDTKRIEMNYEGESFIRDVTNTKHSLQAPNEILNETGISKEGGIEGISFQKYPAFSFQTRGNSSGVLSPEYIRPAPQQQYYVVKSSNLSTNWDQTQLQAYTHPVARIKFIENESPLSSDDDRERYPLLRPTNNTLRSETSQQVEKNPAFAHKLFQSPPSYDAAYSERFGDPQVKNFNQTLKEFPSKNDPTLSSPTVGSSDNQTNSTPPPVSDGKSQSKPEKFQGFTKLTATHLQPMKQFHKNPFTADLYITKKPCEICCKPEEVEPCTSCCNATPLLSVRTLKTVLG